jgi:molybdopterin-guanine dinucleotide biosynthesis protein A
MARTLGVIVAGGRGARLGLQLPKALARVGGLTLLERALATADAVCDDAVVAAPADLELPVPAARRIVDTPDADGPLAGIVAGLASRSFERAVILGVDFPLLGSATLAAMLARLPGRRAVIPAPGGIEQPLVSVCDAGAEAVLSAALRCGERSVIAAMRRLDPRLLDDEAIAGLPGGPSSFFNLNTPADLDEAERRLRGPVIRRGAA